MMGGGRVIGSVERGPMGVQTGKRRSVGLGGSGGRSWGGPWGAGGRYPLGLVRGTKYVRTLLRVLRQVRSPVAEA